MGFLRKAKRSKETGVKKAKDKFFGKIRNLDALTDKQIDDEWKELAQIESNVMTAYELTILHEKYRMSKKVMLEFSEHTGEIAWLLTHEYKDDGRYEVGVRLDKDGNEQPYFVSGHEVAGKSITMTDLKKMIYEGVGIVPKERVKRPEQLEYTAEDRDYLHLLAKKRRSAVTQDAQNFETISMFVLMEKYGWKKQKLMNLQETIWKVDRDSEYGDYVLMVEKLKKNLSLDCGTVPETDFNKVRYGYEVVDENGGGLRG